ncbi:RecQ family ATP-dependent DNA helicase [Sinorhizobium sp. 7-81]|uniref:RecQ family ATP-dependent DNA helicase n=1 Tax=Sinorhizobium sp. 8-89 TaxID=3049089 RepID=UPI0024C3656C|nr:RecQ family ATP-dependent DNA helicase [Sinorhizobium sp. 8-89]MDK1488649.1 RecQ family ATP-dependent DNA helicase [Sinorhizobium sp. 8-89]
MEHDEARELLHRATSGAASEFKDGQWAAINAIANHRQRVLLVQRTGWGKSMVYFLATRMMRDTGAGPTLIISPLLALMRNQLEAAERLGIQAVTINTTNRDDWDAIMARVRADEVDLLLVSPERLANQEFLDSCLLPIADRIQFLVVDEAHCISDWGHDFRPDYQRIDRILAQLPPNVAVLATTATANDRVVADVMAQLGTGTLLQRGPLARPSLSLQTVLLPDRAARFAWLAEAVRQLPGSGIVYALTKRDVNRITEWLLSQGIDARAYHSGVGGEDEDGEQVNSREELEGMLLRNEVKALVATNALGMGFDKPDLSFVVHFQAPQSIVHYYQQVGRAGRGIDDAYGVLLGGAEDDEINSYFIGQSFPPERQVESILDALAQADDGISVVGLIQAVNLRKSQIEKVLKMLSVASSGLVAKEGYRWYRTVNPYQSDRNRVERLTGQRQDEWDQVQAYLETDECLMRFLREALDDPDADDCGRCSNCLGYPVVNVKISDEAIAEASRFIKRSDVAIKPRKRWETGAFATYGWAGNIPLELRCEEGRALSVWRDAGWGTRVDDEKETGRFSDELVEACAEMIEERWHPRPAPSWVTCVPSLRSEALVPDFAERLAVRLGIPFIDAVSKVKETQRQRNMMNSWQQSSNLDGAFEIDTDLVQDGSVLLVDDVVDSRWSLTVIGALLREVGAGPVFPLVLASASAAGD